MRNCFRAAGFPGSSRRFFAARSTGRDQPFRAALCDLLREIQQRRCDVRQSGCISSMCSPKNYTLRSLSEISQITRSAARTSTRRAVETAARNLRDLESAFTRTLVQLPSGPGRQTSREALRQCAVAVGLCCRAASLARTGRCSACPAPLVHRRDRLQPRGLRGLWWHRLPESPWGNTALGPSAGCDRSMRHAGHELS